MLKHLCTLMYSLTNTLNVEAYGIASGDSKVVALNPSFMIKYGDEALLKDIQCGIIKVTDILGDDIAPQWAGISFLDLQSEVRVFRDSLHNAETYVSKGYGKAIRASWNLNALNALSALIAEDILCFNFTAAGLDEPTEINKMASAMTLVNMGMFQEAANVIPSIAQDAFFTPSRLTQYQTIVLGADAFSVVL